jgi:hypothetical protein
MRRSVYVVFILISGAPAMAQIPLGPDCRPQTIPGYYMAPQPQDIECLRKRAQAEAAAQAAQEAAQRQAAQQAAFEQVKQQAIEQAQVRAQSDAEESPDNFCKTPEVARRLIDGYNSLDWDSLVTRKVVDIEHLVTIQANQQTATFACHGVWVHTNGLKLEGTMTFRPNVAGDVIYTWKPGTWSPPVDINAAIASVTPPSMPATIETAPSTGSGVPTSFGDGLAARQSWEGWVQQINGDYKTGALYWASQRSLSHPGSCSALAGDAVGGCEAAKARLTASDAMRKSDSDYRRGWNSYTPPG